MDIILDYGLPKVTLNHNERYTHLSSFEGPPMNEEEILRLLTGLNSKFLTQNKFLASRAIKKSRVLYLENSKKAKDIERIYDQFYNLLRTANIFEGKLRNVGPNELIFDVNIPKKVYRLEDKEKMIPISKIDTEMDDEEILKYLNNEGGTLVTHDRGLAIKALNISSVAFIRDNIPWDDIATCLSKHEEIFKKGISIFCTNKIKCKNCC